ncbi:hypothetical protein P4S72_27015 [Vibrio sp. PP-XX7]
MKPDPAQVNPPWYSEPCLTRKAEPFVILSELPPETKKLVWTHIQASHPSVADLLKSDEFQQFRQQLETQFGPVGIGVDLKDIGGSLYGVRRKTQTDN